MKTSLLPIHRIDVSLNPTQPDGDTRQITWKLKGKRNQGLNEPIHSSEVVQWHFSDKFFLYIDENKSHVDWDTCTDADGNELPWITDGLRCPFDQPNHRALCATNNGDWVVSIVFPPDAVLYKDNIPYRLVTGDCPQVTLHTNKRALSAPYDYYMVEPILVWDDPTLQPTRASSSARRAPKQRQRTRRRR
jgi:hypothetical protein